VTRTHSAYHVPTSAFADPNARVRPTPAEERRNPGPRCVGQVGVVEASTHRTVPLAWMSVYSRQTSAFQTASWTIRFDVLVQAKEVPRVVLLLDGFEPVVVGTERSFDRVFSLLT
jgi:hypothetical protein